MPNVTISLSEELLEASRKYASRHNTSLNAMIRAMLHQRVVRAHDNWADELFKSMDKAMGDSKGWKWNREEIQRYGE